jgi:hypothetical protein
MLLVLPPSPPSLPSLPDGNLEGIAIEGDLTIGICGLLILVGVVIFPTYFMLNSLKSLTISEKVEKKVSYVSFSIGMRRKDSS